MKYKKYLKEFSELPQVEPKSKMYNIDMLYKLAVNTFGGDTEKLSRALFDFLDDETINEFMARVKEAKRS